MAGRYVRPPETDSKLPIPPTGSLEDCDAKPAIVLAGVQGGPNQPMRPLRAVNEQGLLAVLSAQR